MLGHKKALEGLAKVKELKKALIDKLKENGEMRREHLKTLKAGLQVPAAVEQAKQLYSSLTV